MSNYNQRCAISYHGIPFSFYNYYLKMFIPKVEVSATKTVHFTCNLWVHLLPIFTGQKHCHTKLFPNIFHIKPLLFKTFSWSHSLSSFHEIFSIQHWIAKCNSNQYKHVYIFAMKLNQPTEKKLVWKCLDTRAVPGLVY